jgi:hypothetical protein
VRDPSKIICKSSRATVVGTHISVKRFLMSVEWRWRRKSVHKYVWFFKRRVKFVRRDFWILKYKKDKTN